MQIIRGEEKVEEAIKKQLITEKEKFRKRIKGTEAKFLFVLLQSMNYLVGDKLLIERDGYVDKIDIPTYRLLMSMRAMLDIILKSRFSAVQVVSKNEFLEIFSILKEHIRIGFLSHIYYIQKTSPVREIKIEDGQIVEVKDEDSIYFYKALQKWVELVSIDSNWTNWLFSSRFQEKRARVGKLLRKGFEAIYHLKAR